MVRRACFALCISILVSSGMLVACGGGGSSGGTAPSQPTAAILKLMTSGTGTTIYGIDVTMNLPAGVTVKSTNPPETDSGVVTVSGVASGSIVTAVYTPASWSAPGKVRILIANATGFTTGEFATINTDIADGRTPRATDFGLVSFSAIDADLQPITGLTFGFTTDIH